jgi:hypothetical protein
MRPIDFSHNLPLEKSLLQKFQKNFFGDTAAKFTPFNTKFFDSLKNLKIQQIHNNKNANTQIVK